MQMKWSQTCEQQRWCCGPLRGGKMIFCHKGLNSFEGSKKSKQMPSEGSRKREIVGVLRRSGANTSSSRGRFPGGMHVSKATCIHKLFLGLSFIIKDCRLHILFPRVFVPVHYCAS